MMNESIEDRLIALKDTLTGISAIAVEKFSIVDIPPEVADYAALFDDGKLPQGLSHFYKEFNGFECKWSAREEPQIAGYARFLRLEDMFPYWDGKWTLQPEDPAADSQTEDFFPIDFFNDDACVGAFRARKNEPSLYYYNFHGAPQNLFLDIHGYFELMLYAKAYRYWQYLILEIETGERSSMGDALRNGMTLLGLEFNMEEFIALYNRHKI